MSNERDEMAGDLAAAYGSHDGTVTEVDKGAAVALLAAGYRKPRTITTAEELDALPNESVLLNTYGDAIQIRHDLQPAEWWHWIVNDPGDVATVIWEPEA